MQLPRWYMRLTGQKLIFPKDADAGGTWIAVHENGNAAVLLNGAFEKHVANTSLSQKPGHDIFENHCRRNQPVNLFDQIDLEQIEPFTLILLEKNNLYECRWDGRSKHCKPLKKHRPYIWSSATLYDKSVIEKRETMVCCIS